MNLLNDKIYLQFNKYIIYFWDLKTFFQFFIFPRLFWPNKKWTRFLCPFLFWPKTFQIFIFRELKKRYYYHNAVIFIFNLFFFVTELFFINKRKNIKKNWNDTLGYKNDTAG